MSERLHCDIRGSLELLILKVLSESPCHGYSLMKKLEAVFGKKPSPGAVYPLLRDLLEKGYVEVRIRRRGGRVLKVYHITEEGLRALESRREELEKAEKTIMGFKEVGEMFGDELAKLVYELVEKLPRLTREQKKMIESTMKSCIQSVRRILSEVSE